ncbi:hypothetical protein [Streptomyces sp. AcE210]|uniref:hypothetical protein n=1 Tax=Streptomyces sp. AcE210 TaxID=2292703 RepID=UPI001404D663|nr:hypothetical protein [Streptomyces sp. AcE210]
MSAPMPHPEILSAQDVREPRKGLNVMGSQFPIATRLSVKSSARIRRSLLKSSAD